MQKASLSRCSTPVRPSPQLCYHRRSVLVLPLLSPWLLITKQVEASPGGVDSMESPFVQELLRKTAEKKDERRAERLKDYYRRNYKDFFDFLEGSDMEGSQGLSSATASEIRKWMQENKEKELPGIKRLSGK